MGLAHGRIELLFALVNGAEVASTSFSTPDIHSKTLAQMQDMADAVDDKFNTDVWAGSGLISSFPASTSYLGCRVSDVDNAGHVLRSVEHLASSPAPGTATASALPPEVAVVVSLRTGIAGPRGRGRMYMPAPAVSKVTASGFVDSGFVTTLATNMAQFFHHLNISSTFLATVGVYSAAASLVNAVQAVKVGNVYDAQRRRRDALAEAYTTVAV